MPTNWITWEGMDKIPGNIQLTKSEPLKNKKPQQAYNLKKRLNQ
jgi:hypothetical protein